MEGESVRRHLPHFRSLESDREDVSRAPRHSGLPPLKTSTHSRYASPSQEDPPPPPPAAYSQSAEEHRGRPPSISQQRMRPEPFYDDPIPPPPEKYSYPLPSISEALKKHEGPPRSTPTQESCGSYRRYSNDSQSADRYTQSREYEAQRGPMRTPYSSAPNLSTPAVTPGDDYHRGSFAGESQAMYRSGPPPEPERRPSHPPHSTSYEQWRPGYAPPPPDDHYHRQGAYAQPPTSREAMPPPPGPSSASIYTPSLSNPHTPSTAPSSAGFAPLQSTSYRDGDLKKPQKPIYGDSIKRHLDTFDLEQSLDTMSESSHELLDFSDYYRQKAHNSQRAGPIPGSTPHLQQIDDMMKHGSRIQESLNRLRDVVVAQQAEEAELSRDKAAKLASAEKLQQEEAKAANGFAGSDPKKRRGRAAPPGKCHSCNRVDTPEWRRGPDGARTLCNACGLHYAKLTRKSGNGKAAQGSDLRPQVDAEAP